MTDPELEQAWADVHDNIPEDWHVGREQGNLADVVAVRGKERLICSASCCDGWVTPRPHAGLSLPSKVVSKVMRVPREVLDGLGIEVYEVTITDGVVRVL